MESSVVGRVVLIMHNEHGFQQLRLEVAMIIDAVEPFVTNTHLLLGEVSPHTSPFEQRHIHMQACNDVGAIMVILPSFLHFYLLIVSIIPSEALFWQYNTSFPRIVERTKRVTPEHYPLDPTGHEAAREPGVIPCTV